MHVRFASGILEKSSLQTCCFKSIPGTIRGGPCLEWGTSTPAACGVSPFFAASAFLKRGLGQKAQKAQPLQKDAAGSAPPGEGLGSEDTAACTRAGGGCHRRRCSAVLGDARLHWAAHRGFRCSPSGRLRGVQDERGMRWEGFIPAACGFSKEIYWKCHPRLPGQTLFCFLRAA